MLHQVELGSADPV